MYKKIVSNFPGFWNGSVFVFLCNLRHIVCSLVTSYWFWDPHRTQLFGLLPCSSLTRWTECNVIPWQKKKLSFRQNSLSAAEKQGNCTDMSTADKISGVWSWSRATVLGTNRERCICMALDKPESVFSLIVGHQCLSRKIFKGECRASERYN